MPVQKDPSQGKSLFRRSRRISWGFLLSIFCFLIIGMVVLAQSGDYQLRRSVFSNSGAYASSTSYRINYSLGQPSTVGNSSGTDYQVRQGYWRAGSAPTAGPSPTPTSLPLPTPLVHPMLARYRISTLFDHTSPNLIADDQIIGATGAHVQNDPNPPVDDCGWQDPATLIWVWNYSDTGEIWSDLRWDQDLPCGGTGGPGWLSYDGHNGYDIACANGTLLNAAGEGTVYHEGGSTLFIEQGWLSYRMVYRHMISRTLDVGEQAVPGELVGQTGLGHLHFEVKRFVDGSWRYIDPDGWQGTGNDPVIYDVGNLWTAGYPIPMGYRDQTIDAALSVQGPFSLTSPILEAWFTQPHALGSPTSQLTREDSLCFGVLLKATLFARNRPSSGQNE